MKSERWTEFGDRITRAILGKREQAEELTSEANLLGRALSDWDTATLMRLGALTAEEAAEITSALTAEQAPKEKSKKRGCAHCGGTAVFDALGPGELNMATSLLNDDLAEMHYVGELVLACSNNCGNKWLKSHPVQLQTSTDGWGGWHGSGWRPAVAGTVNQTGLPDGEASCFPSEDVAEEAAAELEKLGLTSWRVVP